MLFDDEIKEALEDDEDLKLLREEKEKSRGQAIIPLDQVINELDL